LKKSRLFQLVITVIVILVVIGLVYWTVSSPPALVLQSHSSIANGIFSFSKSQSSFNITDGSGSYSIKFGLDYLTNITFGSESLIKVYGVLASEQITSQFTRGISLAVNSASLFIDGIDDSSVSASNAITGGILTESFQNPNTSIPIGSHNLTIRMIVSTVDLNYVGYFAGTPEIVVLSGLFNVTQS
jgi:hypothetical protein